AGRPGRRLQPGSSMAGVERGKGQGGHQCLMLKVERKVNTGQRALTIRLAGGAEGSRLVAFPFRVVAVEASQNIIETIELANSERIVRERDSAGRDFLPCYVETEPHSCLR